ncbi:hypothetical protein OEB99_11220 [Actinotalea sp. M2MS4P-6]|uniref:LamG-like jellyroll fold domain-containing protein n=1 Tax=Actinotalea sp. M2MS4P-6 TaxID=2983762 RepID=UPI0021E4129A|nr:LamG-like jellyroll fold domain-containing protein [Actinotalea sp. M2MS4P-6]MCV2394881.1 hypothetical protein [Actinotalea sp. M2MS4P-6]
MRSARSERLTRLAVAAAAALLGVAVGLALPRVGSTAAAYVDSAAVSTPVSVRPCSGTWSSTVASLGPIRHLDFAAASALPGDVAAPGLLTCDDSGALTLHGSLEESWADPAGALTSTGALSVTVWTSFTDTATPGDLLWLTQADGYGLGLGVSGGLLQVVEVPPGGGPPTVLVQTGAPGSAPHLVTMTRSDAALTVYLDATPVGSATLSATSVSDVSLVLGAPAGSGDASAHAVLDEVVVVPVTLDAGQVATLAGSNVW